MFLFLLVRFVFNKFLPLQPKLGVRVVLFWHLANFCPSFSENEQQKRAPRHPSNQKCETKQSTCRVIIQRAAKKLTNRDESYNHHNDDAKNSIAFVISAGTFTKRPNCNQTTEKKYDKTIHNTNLWEWMQKARAFRSVYGVEVVAMLWDNPVIKLVFLEPVYAITQHTFRGRDDPFTYCCYSLAGIIYSWFSMRCIS